LQASLIVVSPHNSCPDGFEHEGIFMSKQIAFVLTGLTLAMSSVGCCCLGHGYGANRCAPCNTGCPPAGGGYYTPQTGALYQGYDASQTAYLSGTTQTAVVPSSAIIGAPIMASPGGYTTTVMVPANSLPTY
jgi:hypothetical protein